MTNETQDVGRGKRIALSVALFIVVTITLSIGRAVAFSAEPNPSLVSFLSVLICYPGLRVIWRKSASRR